MHNKMCRLKQMNPLSFHCTAIPVVFLYLAESNARAVFGVLEPHKLFSTIGFFFFCLVFVFQLSKKKSKKKKKVTPVFVLCAGIGEVMHGSVTHKALVMC